jgi:prepilin-type N-terminal cleavage/methylation domain-containing protein
MKLPEIAKSNRREAFTLVEVLVVVAIILMLVALLMPALQKIKETAKNTKCINNLRQISMATFLYGADNDGLAPWDSYTVGYDSFFIEWSRNPSDGNLYKSWYPKNKWFAEYLPGRSVGKMNAVGYCPKGGRLGEQGPTVKMAGQDYMNVSYGLNPDFGEDWWLSNGNPDRCNIPITQIKDSAHVAMWVDANKSKCYVRGESVSGRHFSTGKRPALTPGPTIGTTSVFQYEGRVNVLFVDQHVSSISFPEQAPYYACRFWRYSSPYPCAAKLDCKLCDSKKDY